MQLDAVEDEVVVVTIDVLRLEVELEEDVVLLETEELVIVALVSLFVEIVSVCDVIVVVGVHSGNRS